MMEVKSNFKMTELGKIPVEWEIYPLKELASGDKVNSFIDGDWIESKDMSKEGVRIIQTGNIGIGRFIEKKAKRYISETTFEKLNCKEIYEGDMLICRLADPIGRACLIPAKEERLITSVDITIFRPSKQYDSKYLVYYINSDENLSEVKKYTSGTTRQRISRGNLAKVLIKVPPLKEQQKIAEILSTVDEQIEQTDQLIEKTKELKKGLMQQLLTKGIGHTEFKQTELGYIPIDWKIKSLNEITTDVTIGLVTSMTKNYVDNGIPLIRNSDIKEGFVRTEKMVNLSYDFASSNKHKMLKRGDIVTIHTGDIGTSAVIEDNLIGALGFATLQTTVPDNTSSEWLMLFFNSEIAKKQFYNFSTGDGRNNLNLKEFVKTRIIVPNLLEEQNKISSIISTVDEKIKGYENEKSKYEELKKGLIQQLLTGKTRVKVD
ncbi:restriction endonuclease subunit S [Jeotgalibaca porci]|nr:restriction endonuclease subunit S [Jeotgalibaca porci]